MSAFAWAGVALAGLTLGGFASAEEPSDPYAAGGRAVYAKWCAPCHDPGVIHPGTNALTGEVPGRQIRRAARMDSASPEAADRQTSGTPWDFGDAAVSQDRDQRCRA